MPKKKKLVSAELSRVLDRLTGIPVGNERKALAAVTAAEKLKGPGPAKAFGIWVGGCYYVRDKNGNVQGKHGTYRLEYCLS